MELTVKYCNNIDSASIVLSEKKLNIKFAPNGTGKSTIAKAIQYSLENDDSSLNELIPFKFRELNPDNNNPQVIGIENLRSVMCFNEDYVQQVVLQKEELVTNSFDIFIRNDYYRQVEQEIEVIVRKIKEAFVNNSNLETLLSNLKELSGAFKATKSGLSKASKGMKGLSGGNKIRHIPPGLEPFSPFIKSEKNINWIDWQVKGQDFSGLATSCPFCTSDTSDKKEQIQKVGQEYNKSIIKNLVGIIQVIDKLGDYFSDNAKENLSAITTLKETPEKEHEDVLLRIKKQIDNFIDKLEKIRTLSGFDFKEGENVSEKLPSYKLNLQFFEDLDSNKTQAAVLSINQSIENLTNEAGLLQGKINIQRSEIKKIIRDHHDEINNFLTYAGYRYKVDMSGRNEEHLQLKLLHYDYNEYVSGGRQHLSFGERNAFALVLFMYECLAKKPDLIILDDPISSFDKNKKYAILEKLFQQDSSLCLKGKTVLMLTHDIESIIDTVKSLKKKFNNQISASHLKYSRGTITESPIRINDIQTFTQICNETIASDKDDIIKLIYLRRLSEITNENGDDYQVLSNLFHKRSSSVDKREERDAEGNYPVMAEDKFKGGCLIIQNHIQCFNYKAVLILLQDIIFLTSLYDECQNGYEKLQLFRLLDLDVENSVIRKFMNETYHIENEFICQLNPNKFDTIPEYVIEECNKQILDHSMVES